MRIGLVDVDGHNFPNLCLMKLSAWHKMQGNQVELLKPEDIICGNNLFTNYEKLYGACVFSWNKWIADKLSDFGVEVGGIGSGSKKVLPDEIEHCYPDYSLYGIIDEAYGFLTRGCPRHCPFCVVGDKEGLVSRKVADLSEFWNGQKNVVLCDPNLLACKDRMELLQQLIDSKAWVDVNQGFDARLLDDEVIFAMNKIRFKQLHFAWDNPQDKKVPKCLESFAKKTKIKDTDKKVTVYVLTNYWSSIEQDLYRIYWLREHLFNPYVMVFNKDEAPVEILKLQRWCNNKRLFAVCKKFEDYQPQKRGKQWKEEMREEDLW